MPRVIPLTEEKRFLMTVDELPDRCLSVMRRNGVTMTSIADAIGTSVQNVSQQFGRNHISTDILLAVIQLGDLNQDEIERLVRT